MAPRSASSKEQPVWIGYQGKAGDLVGRKFTQDLLAPVCHLSARPTHAASMRVNAWSYQSMSFWSSWKMVSGIFSATAMMVS